jgi:cytochrome P450
LESDVTAAPPTAAERQYSEFNISDAEFWGRPFEVRDHTFARLRAQDGLSWHQPLESIFGLVEPGFWALTRRSDIVHVSQHPDLFTSAQGVALSPLPIEIQRISTFFLTMDPPEHTVYRRLISSAFTPKQLRRIEDQVHRNAVLIVDDLIGAGEIDFVKTCSARLPMLTIAEMLGVAEDKRERVAQAGEAIFSSSDEEYASRQERAEFAMRETQLLVETAIELAQLRRRRPGDDLMTNIVNAEVDGTRLTDEQIGAFMILLTSAGNDTTKQTTTHAMKALVEHPDQRAWLMEDFDSRIGPAIEEFVRWASPVIQFARFATQDTEIAGQRIAAGEKVGLFYCSANRDESVFGDPHRFDLARSPNPHIAFGGLGPHYCLGNQLAKFELRHLFRELLTRLRRVEFGEPAYLQSSFVHGIKRLPAFVQ